MAADWVAAAILAWRRTGGDWPAAWRTPPPVGAKTLSGVDAIHEGGEWRDDEPSAPELQYTLYTVPTIAEVHPTAAHTAAGTLVTVRGAGFAQFGAPWQARCRFGDGAGGHLLLTVAASLAADGASLACRSPQPAALGSAPLQLALNGQDYEPAPALPFAFYAPPSLRAVVPAGQLPLAQLG